MKIYLEVREGGRTNERPGTDHVISGQVTDTLFIDLGEEKT